MGIQLPDKCLRNGNDCTPLSQIAADDGGSFWCCGLNDGTGRTVEGDKFTVCFQNSVIDECGHWDRRDLTEMMSILAQALSVDANMEENNATQREKAL